MIASQDVAAGSPVLYVPEELIMSSNKAMAAYRNEQMEAAEKQLEITDAMTEIRQYYLMIQLLVEMERGTERCVMRTCVHLHKYFSTCLTLTSMPFHNQPMVSMAQFLTSLL